MMMGFLSLFLGELGAHFNITNGKIQLCYKRALIDLEQIEKGSDRLETL